MDTVLRIMRNVGFILGYGFFFWRIAKRYPDDKFIRWGAITTMGLVLGFVSFKIGAPTWVWKLLGLSAGVSAFTAIYYLLQQWYDSLRHRKTK